MHFIVRFMRAAMVALVVGLACAAPAASDPGPGTAPLELADTAWQFVEVLGAAPPSTAEATLGLFADGTATGRSGCNLFYGRYVVVDEGLTFTDLGYTKMACAPELMKTETAVQAALNRTTSGM
ncbi:MAG: META domain-containing protein, partial [Mycobacterium sp.]